MNKNYYEILQVNQNASNEIIEKAYKTLAKKYHPDLYKQENKKEAEEIFKKINEAYETLSNSTKRQLYDENLNSTTISKEKYEQMCLQNKMLKEQLQNLTLEYNKIISQKNNFSNNSFFNESNTNYKNINTNSSYYNGQVNNDSDTYYNNNNYSNDTQVNPEKYSHNLLYFLRYRLNNPMKSLISILIILFILFLLLQLPFVQDYFHNLYNDNALIRFFVNIFKGIFNIK